jgi:hypothetical protein
MRHTLPRYRGAFIFILKPKITTTTAARTPATIRIRVTLSILLLAKMKSPADTPRLRSKGTAGPLRALRCEQPTGPATKAEAPIYATRAEAINAANLMSMVEWFTAPGRCRSLGCLQLSR